MSSQQDQLARWKVESKKFITGLPTTELVNCGQIFSNLVFEELRRRSKKPGGLSQRSTAGSSPRAARQPTSAAPKTLKLSLDGGADSPAHARAPAPAPSPTRSPVPAAKPTSRPSTRPAPSTRKSPRHAAQVPKREAALEAARKRKIMVGAWKAKQQHQKQLERRQPPKSALLQQEARREKALAAVGPSQRAGRFRRPISSKVKDPLAATAAKEKQSAFIRRMTEDAKKRSSDPTSVRARREAAISAQEARAKAIKQQKGPAPGASKKSVRNVR